MESYQINEHILLRFAEEKDIDLVFEFIRALAEYEHLLDTVKLTKEGLREYLFEKKLIEAVIGEYDGTPAAFALYYYNFSTFAGNPGIFIEDLFVKPQYRGKGLGKIFFDFLAKIALERKCGRLEWVCLDWNQSSIDFYKKQGAKPRDEWTIYRLSEEGMRPLAKSSNFTVT